MIPSLYTLKVQYVILAFLGVPFSYLFDLHFRNDEQYRKTVLDANQEFDFIIVGGGTAGLVVANRLSEHFNTLLIEAGGHPFPLTAVPGLAPSLLNHPDIDWVDKTVPQQHACHAQENNGANLNHGKGLGGSSMLNFMMYMRGSPEDYNEWARVTKDNQWSYENLLPYFRKMENYQGGFSHNGTHGTDGPINIARSPYNKLMYEWQAAAKELGYDIVDPNGYQEAGFFPLEYNTKNGSRHSTYSAYLEPILTRHNLTIEVYAHVTKVEFDGRNRAVGVHYIKDGRQNYVKASKEIILSAGSLGSPKILMLSGVGPAEHLNSLGIPVLQDLPVGQNLQDHILTEIGPFILDSGHSFNPGRDMTVSVFSEYLEYNRGPLGAWLSPGGAVIESSLAEKGWPDLLLFGTSSGVCDGFTEDLSRGFGYKKELLDTYFEGLAGNDTFTVSVALGRPKGRGELKLASIDPFEPPLVDPSYLHHPDDLQALIEGVKFALKIMETETFKLMGARLTTNLLPGCEEHGSAANDEYWKCFVRHLTRTMWHYSSTCKMGAKGDTTAVLDTRLRVRGTKGLRVIDNSIMPQVTNANTHIPAVVIGEKGADLILQKHLKKGKNFATAKEYNKISIKPTEEKDKMALQNIKDDESIIQKPGDIVNAAQKAKEEDEETKKPEKPEDIDNPTQEDKEEEENKKNPERPEDIENTTQEPKEEDEDMKNTETPEDIENITQDSKEEEDKSELQDPKDDGNTIQKPEDIGSATQEPTEDKNERKKFNDDGMTTNTITEKERKKDLKKPKDNGKTTDKITDKEGKKNLKKSKDNGKTTDKTTDKEGKKNLKKSKDNGKTTDTIMEMEAKKDLKKPKDNGKTTDKIMDKEGEKDLKKSQDNGKSTDEITQKEAKNNPTKSTDNGKATDEITQKEGKKNLKKSKDNRKTTDTITENEGKKDLKEPKDDGRTTDTITENEGKKDLKKPKDNGKTADKTTENKDKKDLKKHKDNGKATNTPKAKKDGTKDLKKLKDDGKVTKKLEENVEKKVLKKSKENGKTTKKPKEGNGQKKKSKGSKQNKKTYQKSKEHKKQRKN